MGGGASKRKKEDGGEGAYHGGNDAQDNAMVAAFVLSQPEEVERLRAHCAGRASTALIFKPRGGLQGRGIKISNKPVHVVDSLKEQGLLERYIAQEYVDRPLLLEGMKHGELAAVAAAQLLR